MWIHDMINHANDLFTEYHLYDKEAYEAVEMLHKLLKQGVSNTDAIDQVGDKFYRDENDNLNESIARAIRKVIR